MWEKIKDIGLLLKSFKDLISSISGWVWGLSAMISFSIPFFTDFYDKYGVAGSITLSLIICVAVMSFLLLIKRFFCNLNSKKNYLTQQEACANGLVEANGNNNEAIILKAERSPGFENFKLVKMEGDGNKFFCGSYKEITSHKKENCDDVME
jgi:hypothetical protein